jgi:superfamily II DNA helicase RecQ
MSPIDRRRRIAHIVTKVFSLSGLRPGQQAVIDAVLAGHAHPRNHAD